MIASCPLQKKGFTGMNFEIGLEEHNHKLLLETWGILISHCWKKWSDQDGGFFFIPISQGYS